MASKLIRLAPHEAENEFELSLRQSFETVELQLRPPFPLKIPSPQEYSQLNSAILYGVLTEPHFAKVHIKHLHAIVTDGYGLFVSLLVKVVNELYVKLFYSVKSQLIWVTKEMIDVLAIGFNGLLCCLLRQIVGGDFSDENLWLCFELVSLFLGKWNCLLEEEPLVLSSALYTFLRLLADHCRFSSNEKLDPLKQLEIEFCVKMLREQFHLCLKVGRDLVRLLQDLFHVPVFRAIWKDLVLNPNEFKTPGFSDLSQLYHLRTSSCYFLLRITPEMENQLRFLLTHVKLGSQKRYQSWFAKKFLFGPERETLIVDIVRFICCGHHPSNEVLQSGVIPRWAVIGWLLKCCRKNYVAANAKLALFFDWLFFEESSDKIMNIEPAILLMVCSIPQYIDMTFTLLDFLFLLVDNYDTDHNDIVVRGVTSSFGALVKKGVIHSLDVLTSCEALSPHLKERLGKLVLASKAGLSKELQSRVQLLAPSPERQPTKTEEVGWRTRSADASILVSDDLATPCSSLVITAETIMSLVQNLGEAIKNSTKLGLETLDALLLSFVKLESQNPESASVDPEVLSSKISKEFDLNGDKLFASLENSPDALEHDDEIGSATAFIIRTLIYSQHEKMQKLLLFWLKNGFPVGARILSYASRLAYEADIVKNLMVDNDLFKINASGMELLIFHADGYFSFQNERKRGSFGSVVSTFVPDKELVAKLVDSAFAAYRCFLTYLKTISHGEDDTSLSKLLLFDLISCYKWGKKRQKFLLGSIFRHLTDLSVSEENIINFIVSLDHADLVDIRLEISLKKYSLFGENIEAISHLIMNSLHWDCLEQHKFWDLVRSELAVSKVQVEKIILKFFCSHELDANVDAIAVGGLLSLCNCCAPTPELVGAIMLLPNNVFQDFSAVALAAWVISNASMLFDSLAKFSEKFDKKNEDSVFSDSTGIMINRSAILWLVNHFNVQGTSSSDVLSNLSVSLEG